MPPGVSTRNRPQADCSQQTDKSVVTKTADVRALWKAVTDSIDAGGQHPSFDQKQKFGDATVALQNYLTAHGMTSDAAFEAIYNAVRNYTDPGAGPNAGSEGSFGANLGMPLGGEIGQIFAGVVIGRAGIPKEEADSKLSKGGAEAQIPGEQPSEPKSESDQQGDSPQKRKPDYSPVPDPKNVKPGGDFSGQQKAGALRVNSEANGGQVRSDGDRRVLVQPKKESEGGKPSPDEWQFDHKIPKAHGGTNASSNMQIPSREENRTNRASRIQQTPLK